jgi:hypothetical protein
MAIAVAVAVAGVLSVGANAAFAQGTLEICKSSLNGMSGRTFEYSIAGVATPVSVRGGRCSGPMTVPDGDIAITELPTTPATEVASVVVRPSQRFRSLNGNTAVVNVPPGSTAANETRITFINEPGGGATGDLKVCKLSETPAYWGRQFSFTVNGGPAVSTEANPAFDDPSTWVCRLLGSFTQGTVVRVQEIIPAGSEIAFIDSDPPECLQDFDTNVGYADALIGPGSCVLLFDNEPIPPSGTGFIEVCKDAGFNNSDSEVLGVPFDFTISEPDASEQDITVLGGQCSAPIPVAAGVVRVTEHANPGYSLVGVYTIPEDRLLDANLINRTADVEVPTSDNPNDESQVHFVNIRDRAQLKICKALGPGSSVFIGMEFIFNVVDLDGFQRDPLNPRVIAGASTQCVIVGIFPIGHSISVTEANPPPHSTVTCTPNGGTITMAAGINTVTCTNQALGKIQVCKFSRDELTGALADRLFHFRIDGVRRASVRPNRCSEPILVIPGNHTVAEEADPDFELDSGAPGNGISVTPSEAELSRNLLARSVTISVQWAGADGDEVRVDFWNRIRRGQIKVCKVVAPGSLDSLGDKEFQFTVSSNNTRPVVNTVGGFPAPFVLNGVRNGECRIVPDGSTGQPRNVPILLSNGTPTRITVTETDTANDGWIVSSITLQGGRGYFTTNCVNGTCGPPGSGSWWLGPNTNTITFTNRAVPDP